MKLFIALLIPLLLCGTILIGGGISNKTKDKVVDTVASPILFSINQPGAGFGTVADCTGALLYVHTDRTVRVVMQTEASPEVAKFLLSEEDYQTLEQLIETSDIRNIHISLDKTVCDGNSSYIKFYDENGEEVQKVGGYCPSTPEFKETYSGIKDVLRKYDYYDAIKAFRKKMG